MPFISFNKGNSAQQNPDSRMGDITLIRQTFMDADWYEQANNAYLKNPKQKKPEANISLESLKGFRKENSIFEAGDLLNILRAHKISKEFSVPFVYLGSGQEYQRINELKPLDLKLIMQLEYPKAPMVDSYEDGLESSIYDLRHWERAPYNLKVLEDAKIEFALTSYGLKNKADFLPNLRLSVKNGLSEATAIAALTSIPAKILEMSDRVGSLKNGAFANFIVTDGNIFDEKNKDLFCVYINGDESIQNTDKTIDYRADYNFQLNSKKLSLSIKGDLNKLSATLIKDTTKLVIETIDQSDDKIRFFN